MFFLVGHRRIAVRRASRGRAGADAALTADAATVGLWRFQEGHGERVAGEAGPRRHRTRRNLGAGQGRLRPGYRFRLPAIADDPAIRPEKALTVEVWVKLLRSGGDLICKNSVYMIRLGRRHERPRRRGRPLAPRPRPPPVPVGRWTHLAMTYDSATKTAALYIDGALDVKQEIRDLPTGLINQGTAELYVGQNDWNPTGSEVDGKIDALRISNIARTFEPLSPRRPRDGRRQARPKGNLVPNGDFELGLLGWRLAGEGDANLLWGTDTKDPASGRLSLAPLPGSQVAPTCASKVPHEALLSRPIPAQPGMHYTFSARMRSDAAGRKASIAASAVGGGGGGRGGRAASFSQNAELGAEWKLVSNSFTLPDDWLAPSLCVRIEPPREGQLWVDDVRLMAGEGESSLDARATRSASARRRRRWATSSSPASRSRAAAADRQFRTQGPSGRGPARASWIGTGEQLPPRCVGHVRSCPAGGVKETTLPHRHQPQRHLPTGLRADLRRPDLAAGRRIQVCRDRSA